MSTGTLYIIATPIGNLEDITLRAVRILKEADLIAAEDTRHTKKLLDRYGIATPLTSYHDHNKEEKGPRHRRPPPRRKERCPRLRCGDAGDLRSGILPDQSGRA